MRFKCRTVLVVPTQSLCFLFPRSDRKLTSVQRTAIPARPFQIRSSEIPRPLQRKNLQTERHSASKMSGNMNNASSPKPMGDEFADVWETSLKTFAYCFIAIGSLLGNSLVIVVIFMNRRMRSTINYFIVNMASSDILFTMFVIPRLISELYSQPSRWFIGGTLGSVFCKLDYFVQDISTAVSVLSLVAIAFDRFYGVVSPMKAGLLNDSKVCGKVLASTWLLGSLLHLPYFYGYKLVKRDGHLCCSLDWAPLLDNEKASRISFIIFSMIFFFFPAAILIVVYSTIIITLWRNKTPGNQSLKHRKKIAKRNRNVLKMVVAVVVVFICCWLPVNVSIYILLFKEEAIKSYSKTLFFWVILIAYSNGCISPFLYFIFNENFRQGFRKVFLRRGVRDHGSLKSISQSTKRRSRDVSMTFIKSVRRNKPSN